MAISSTSLFHFTSRQDRLLGILSEGFFPGYALEELSLFSTGADEKPTEVGIPMVCFCDIPLSSAGNHLNTYGCYGIGLTKQWAMAKGLSPVLYAHSSSHFLKALVDIDRHLAHSLQFTPARRLEEALERLHYAAWFIKPYEGRMWRGDRYVGPIRFYDEREWRFVPAVGKPWKLMSSIWNTARSKERIASKGSLRKANLQLRKYALTFQPTDVRYIIVRSDEEILAVIEALGGKGSRFRRVDQMWLASRLISATQITDDF